MTSVWGLPTEREHMLYCISIWIMCDVCLPCIVRLGTDSPVLYPVDRTALRNEASHHQSLLQRVSHSHPTAGWDLNTAQHNAHWTDTARRRSGWHSAPGSDVETLKDKVGMTRFLVTTGAGEHGFRCAGFFSCSLLLWRSSKWNGVTYIHSFPWADHLPAESRKHWKKTFGGAQLQHSSLWTVAHWPLTLQMLTCPFLTVKTLL